MVSSRVIYLIAIIKFNELKFYCVYVYATRFHFQRFPSLEIIIILRFPLETVTHLCVFIYIILFFYFLNTSTWNLAGKFVMLFFDTIGEFRNFIEIKTWEKIDIDNIYRVLWIVIHPIFIFKRRIFEENFILFKFPSIQKWYIIQKF